MSTLDSFMAVHDLRERDEARGALKAHARVTERALANVAEARAEVERLREAAHARLSKGHNDTCSSQLIHMASCDCGQDALRAALAEHEPPAASPGEDGAPT